MSAIKAREYLKQFGLDKNIIEFDEGATATVEAAAASLGCTPGEICKTMAFLTSDGPMVILMAGDKKIDNHLYKEQFHEKAKMVPSEDLENLIGHPMGGVCAFGIKDNVKVYLDDSLKVYDIVYPAAGEPNNAVKLTIPELEHVTNNPEYIHISKD
jgi:prolyl-tRNA editing enzyme YbaK/EbsC (Cys-tRNA(Pro) deacylase)